MKPKLENFSEVTLDARWASADRRVVGASVLKIAREEPRFRFGAVPSPADLFAASLQPVVDRIEREGGLGDRQLILRFPATRGAAFAKLITHRIAPDRFANAGSPALWRLLHAFHASGHLRLAWSGALPATLATPLQHYATLAQQLPADAGLIHVTSALDAAAAA